MPGGVGGAAPRGVPLSDPTQSSHSPATTTRSNRGFELSPLAPIDRWLCGIGSPVQCRQDWHEAAVSGAVESSHCAAVNCALSASIVSLR